MAATRPSIPLVHADQHRFDCLGVNGHPLLNIPNIDRLAAEGTNYTHAFCPVVFCTPARNCLLHGHWPTEHLCICNWDTEAPRPPDESLPAFSQLLRDGGYFERPVGQPVWVPRVCFRLDRIQDLASRPRVAADPQDQRLVRRAGSGNPA
jgi:Sulfatase